jgi:selenocysteine lyase/cysteine desulfurase
MTLSNPKRFYSRFLQGHTGVLHFAAHSHHFWPDVTREAQLSYWDDCAQMSDEKWNKIFGEVIPQTQKHIAHILNLKDPEQIVLAPNTHELTTRLLSLFVGQKQLKVLTTSSEFHSWRRQFLRLSEHTGFQVEQIDASSVLHDRQKFLDEFTQALKRYPDLVFISQVFFDSGLALSISELKQLVAATPASSIFVIDGYHGFAALPTDLSELEGRIFYLGGGYKYAQAGEGVGFMVVPKGNWRPAYTGWFADYAHLSLPPGAKVGYAQNAMAFMGATQDPSGFYRFNAVWNLLQNEGVSVSAIHNYVADLQKAFLHGLSQSFLKTWELKPLYLPEFSWHGHFLTYEASSIEMAEKLQTTLKQHQILIDRRGQRLRFGFGLYQDLADVNELCRRLDKLALKTQ